jgi:hypothetical protein
MNRTLAATANYKRVSAGRALQEGQCWQGSCCLLHCCRCHQLGVYIDALLSNDVTLLLQAAGSRIPFAVSSCLFLVLKWDPCLHPTSAPDKQQLLLCWATGKHQ